MPEKWQPEKIMLEEKEEVSAGVFCIMKVREFRRQGNVCASLSWTISYCALEFLPVTLTTKRKISIGTDDGCNLTGSEKSRLVSIH